MKTKPTRKDKRRVPKTVLRLPDIEVARSAVLNSLYCPDAQRGYRHAIDEFVDRYCSEPRLSFSKTVVVRYRMHLESRHLAPGTINLGLGGIRRLAYEASDCGLLSADLAAGRRVKGVKKLGVRFGNWLTAEQGQALWQAPDRQRLKGKRDRALFAVLLSCGLRRHELAELTFGHLQQREGHWAIVDLSGKAGHVRTIPVPDWVYDLVDRAWEVYPMSTSRNKSPLAAVGGQTRRQGRPHETTEFVRRPCRVTRSRYHWSGPMGADGSVKPSSSLTTNTSELSVGPSVNRMPVVYTLIVEKGRKPDTYSAAATPLTDAPSLVVKAIVLPAGSSFVTNPAVGAGFSGVGAPGMLLELVFPPKYTSPAGPTVTDVNWVSAASVLPKNVLQLVKPVLVILMTKPVPCPAGLGLAWINASGVVGKLKEYVFPATKRLPLGSWAILDTESPMPPPIYLRN
jgi:integrase